MEKDYGYSEEWGGQNELHLDGVASHDLSRDWICVRGRNSACKCLVMQHCRNIPLGGGREIYGWKGWKSKIDYCEVRRSVLYERQ